MPGIQYLGEIESDASRAIGAMSKAGAEYFEGKTARAEKSRELGIAEGLRTEEQRRYEQERETDLSKIDYDKKVKAANMIIDAKKHMGDAQASELDGDPQIKALFEDLDWPYPEGSLMGKPDIEIEAFKALTQGVPLPGTTMEETKKLAGALVSERKITGTDVKAFEEATPIPLWERITPGVQSKAGKERLEFRKKFREQFIKGGRKGATGDPLNVR